MRCKRCNKKMRHTDDGTFCSKAAYFGLDPRTKCESAYQLEHGPLTPVSSKQNKPGRRQR